MKLTGYIFLCVIVFAANIGCSQKSELLPNGIQKVTLKPGESFKLESANAAYNIKYESITLGFGEGLVEDNTIHTYQQGIVNLIVNSDSIRVSGFARYDNKGGRTPKSWENIKETGSVVSIGSSDIGLANFFPISADFTRDRGFVVELLIFTK